MSREGRVFEVVSRLMVRVGRVVCCVGWYGDLGSQSLARHNQCEFRDIFHIYHASLPIAKAVNISSILSVWL